MLKIGEFSKLSHITVKALRFYEKEGLLEPVYTDPWNGYRFYETAQLQTAAKIKSFRQLDFSVTEIRKIINGADPRELLTEKIRELREQKKEIDVRLSIIYHILEEKEMKYNPVIKEIPEQIVYFSEIRIQSHSDIMRVIPTLGAECLELNPGIRCTEPPYEFCEFPENEHKEENFRFRHYEAVDRMGNESERIKFRKLPAAKVLSIFHQGPYEEIGEAYAYIMKYAEENGYRTAGLARECYIDGIWNKESSADWLTEIQLPIDVNTD